MGCLADTTDSTRLRRELEHQATFDPLTGCRNRTAVLADLDAVLAKGAVLAPAPRPCSSTSTCSRWSTTGSARRGGRTACHAAATLHAAAGPSAIVGRLGGDEFLIVCPNVPSAEAARNLADRIARAMHPPGHVEHGDSDIVGQRRGCLVRGLNRRSGQAGGPGRHGHVRVEACHRRAIDTPPCAPLTRNTHPRLRTIVASQPPANTQVLDEGVPGGDGAQGAVVFSGRAWQPCRPEPGGHQPGEQRRPRPGRWSPRPAPR